MSADDTATAEVLAVAPAGSTALERRPIIDVIPAQSLALLRAKVNAASKTNVSDAEIGAFLEICHAYQLDPFVGEAWLVKSSEKNVLLMVGRDGLRKVAHRSELRTFGDVIHEADDFKVEHTRDGRFVTHGYAHPSQRGPIIGAWAQVIDRNGDERGFFVATMDEYRPTSPDKLRYSPWGSQESVMILAAAERQALRQATPLSGLIAQGELDRSDERAEGYTLSPAEEDERLENLLKTFPPGTASMVQGVVARARELRHANFSDVATVEMTLKGQAPEFVEAWAEDADREMDGFEAQAPPEAEVVGPEDRDLRARATMGDPRERPATAAANLAAVDPAAWPEADNPRCGVPDPSRQNKACVLREDHPGPHYADEQAWDSFLPEEDTQAQAQRLRDEANELLDRAQALRDQAPTALPESAKDGYLRMADEAEAEAEEKRAEADRLSPEPDEQQSLGDV